MQWLTDAIKRNGRRRQSRLLSLTGSLILYDPTHPLVESGLKTMLTHAWNVRTIFANSGFPADRINWTPALVAEIEAFATGDEKGSHGYELYWIAKAHPFSAVKTELLRQVRDGSYFRFWPARALVEVWGAADPEVRAALLAILGGPGEDIASIAEALPAGVRRKA